MREYCFLFVLQFDDRPISLRTEARNLNLLTCLLHESFPLSISTAAKPNWNLVLKAISSQPRREFL